MGCGGWAVLLLLTLALPIAVRARQGAGTHPSLPTPMPLPMGVGGLQMHDVRGAQVGQHSAQGQGAQAFVPPVGVNDQRALVQGGCCFPLPCSHTHTHT